MHRKVLVLIAGIATALAGVAGIPSVDGASAAPVPATSGPPVGAFEGYSVSFSPPDYMAGWAADPSAPGQPIEVRAYLDGKFYGSATTGRARADVKRAFPWAGPSTGWRIALDPTGAGLGPPGWHTMCAYAINVGPGANSVLGCRNIPNFAPNPPGIPIGAVDKVVVSPGLIRLMGWAGDPNGAPTTRMIIHVDNGYEVETVASLPRPDVRAATGLSNTTGFDVTLPVKPGTRWFDLFLENSGMGDRNPTLASIRRVIPEARAPGPHDPRGDLEGTTKDDIGPDELDWNASGWAWDPDTSGPIKVLVRSLGYGATDRRDNGNYMRTLSTGVARPDVQEMDPGAGPNAGFSGHIVTTHFGYLFYTCFYAINSGPGKNEFLGCSSP